MDKSKKTHYRLPRTRVLKKSLEIRDVLTTGVRIPGKNLNLFTKTANGKQFAVLTPKRVGNAVKRNKMKRLIREIYRTHPEWFDNMKVIVFVKRYIPHFSTLESEVRKLVTRI